MIKLKIKGFFNSYMDYSQKRIILQVAISIIISTTVLISIYFHLYTLNSKLTFSWIELDYSCLIFSLFFVGIIVSIRYLRFKLLLSMISASFSSKEIFKVTLIGFPLLLLFPGNIGDFLKVFFLNSSKNELYNGNKTHVDNRVLIGTIAWEKVLDLIVVAFAGLISSILVLNTVSTVWSFLILFFILIIVFIIFIVGQKIPPLRKMSDSMREYIKNPINTLKSIIYTAIGWLSVYVIAFYMIRAFRISINFSEIVIFMPIIVIMSVIPIFFGGFGARELGFVLFFGQNTFFAGLLLSIYLVFLPALIGAPILIRNSWLISTKAMK